MNEVGAKHIFFVGEAALRSPAPRVRATLRRYEIVPLLQALSYCCLLLQCGENVVVLARLICRPIHFVAPSHTEDSIDQCSSITFCMYICQSFVLAATVKSTRPRSIAPVGDRLNINRYAQPWHVT